MLPGGSSWKSIRHLRHLKLPSQTFLFGRDSQCDEDLRGWPPHSLTKWALAWLPEQSLMRASGHGRVNIGWSMTRVVSKFRSLYGRILTGMPEPMTRDKDGLGLATATRSMAMQPASMPSKTWARGEGGERLQVHEPNDLHGYRHGIPGQGRSAANYAMILAGSTASSTTRRLLPDTNRE